MSDFSQAAREATLALRDLFPMAGSRRYLSVPVPEIMLRGWPLPAVISACAV